MVEEDYVKPVLQTSSCNAFEHIVTDATGSLRVSDISIVGYPLRRAYSSLSTQSSHLLIHNNLETTTVASVVNSMAFHKMITVDVYHAESSTEGLVWRTYIS